MNHEEQCKEQGTKMVQLIAKCRSDEAFKKKVLAEAAATLKADGDALSAADLSDEDLTKVTGGTIANRFDPYKSFKFRV
jgi:hypothetical protein